LLSIIARISCFLVGDVYALHGTFRALRDHTNHRKWLSFWIVYAPLLVAEYLPISFADIMPGYWEAKCALLCWLLAPRFQGSEWLYSSVVGPAVSKHEQAVDAWLAGVQASAEAKAAELRRQSLQHFRKHSVDLLMRSHGAIVHSLSAIAASTSASGVPSASAPPMAAPAAAAVAEGVQ